MKLDKSHYDIFYLIILQGINFLIPIFLIPFLMLKLGSVAYGYTAFAMAVVQYFILFIDFGFNISATKRIAENIGNEEKINSIFSAVFFSKILFFILSFFAILVLIKIPLLYVYNKAIVISSIYIIGNTFTFNWYFQGLGKIKVLSLISIISRIMILPIIFLLVKSPEDYPIAIFIQSLVFLLTAFISNLWLFKMNLIKHIRYDKTNIINEIKNSFPLFLSSASISIYTQLFIVILGFTTTPAIVGRYSAAEKIMRTITLFVYQPIMQVYYPKISFLAKTDYKKAMIMMNSILKYSLILSCIISFSLFFGSDYIQLYLKNQYFGISVLLKILSFAPIFIMLGGIIGQIGVLIFGKGNVQKKFALVYFIVGVSSFIIVFILSYFLKDIGAAISVTITEFLVLFLMYYIYKSSIIKKNDIYY